MTRLSTLRQATAIATIFALGAFVLATTVKAAGAVQLVPHKAVYELAGKPAGGFGRSGRLRGLLTYELVEDCDGWSVNQKAGLDVSPADGESHRFEWSQSTWEAKDGSSYRYVVKDSQDGGEDNQRRGELRYETPGGAGTLTTQAPERGEAGIPSVLLPVQHTIKMIERANAGDPLFLATIFDATVDVEPVEISAGFGPSIAGGAKSASEFPMLKNVASRHVDFAFFVQDLPDGTPDFEQTIQLFDNGVVSQVTFEFGGLPVLGTLRKLEAIEPESCN